MQEQFKVLIVEDESEIRELISLICLRQGYQVQSVASALEANNQITNQNYDLIILDWMLPQMSGLDFLRELRANSNQTCSVLMVTAKSEPSDIVQGLEAGADDYMTKPFEPAVFIARAKALLRRKSIPTVASVRAPGDANGEADGENDALLVGNISLNLSTYEVRVRGDLVHLTPSEFKILVEMVNNQGKVLTRDHLIFSVQGEGISVTGRTIDTHVFGLRKKLGLEADWIETIRSVGYRVKSSEL